jgi:hypothetical protein
MSGAWPPYHWRSLTLDQRAEIRRVYGLVEPGTAEASRTVANLACRYGRSKRTIYRVIASKDPDAVSLSVNGWIASFEVGDGPPVQVTPWVPA